MPEDAFKACINRQRNSPSSALQTTLDTVEALETENAALRAYLSVDADTDTVTLSGANLYIQSGSGATDGSVNGLGNLILGYNEDATGDDARGGSHTLVIGREHSWTSHGGLITGYDNAITAAGAVVLSGEENTASAELSVVTGGFRNDAEGDYSAIHGGQSNTLTDSHAYGP